MTRQRRVGLFLAITGAAVAIMVVYVALAVFGSDDATGECSMLYFDERGISRRYEVSLRDNALQWWRDDPGFSQRFTGAISADGRTLVGRGEMSRDGGSWEPDLQLTYTRAD